MTNKELIEMFRESGEASFMEFLEKFIDFEDESDYNEEEEKEGN